MILMSSRGLCGVEKGKKDKAGGREEKARQTGPPCPSRQRSVAVQRPYRTIRDRKWCVFDQGGAWDRWKSREKALVRTGDGIKTKFYKRSYEELRAVAVRV